MGGICLDVFSSRLDVDAHPLIDTPAAHGYLVQEYVAMRQQESADAKAQSELSMMTARQLLSILRLSQVGYDLSVSVPALANLIVCVDAQGLARLQFSAQVRACVTRWCVCVDRHAK